MDNQSQNARDKERGRRVREFQTRWRALYPQQDWTESAADLLGLHLRTVTRWAYLERPIPAYAWLVLTLLEGLKANGGTLPPIQAKA